MPVPAKDITALLGREKSQGVNWDELLAEVYHELHGMAERYMRSERRNHTLQPTALVNEACMKLFKWKGDRWHDRGHFLAGAALVMRQILLDYAKQANREKRGGRHRKVPMEDVLVSFEERSLGLVELNDALERLAQEDERSSRVVVLRFFGGMDFSGIADILHVSESTVIRDWRYARAWLFRQLS